MFNSTLLTGCCAEYKRYISDSDAHCSVVGNSRLLTAGIVETPRITGCQGAGIYRRHQDWTNACPGTTQQ